MTGWALWTGHEVEGERYHGRASAFVAALPDGFDEATLVAVLRGAEAPPHVLVGEPYIAAHGFALALALLDAGKDVTVEVTVAQAAQMPPRVAAGAQVILTLPGPDLDALNLKPTDVVRFTPRPLCTRWALMRDFRRTTPAAYAGDRCLYEAAHGHPRAAYLLTPDATV